MLDPVRARILIVDDEPEITAILADLFGEEYDCTSAGSAEEALVTLAGKELELVVSDIAMPGMSGLQASTDMRKDGLDIPVLIFTTHQSERLPQEVRQAGAQGYVLKSQAARDLVLAIDTILSGGTFFGALSESQPSKSGKSNPGILFRFLFAT